MNSHVFVALCVDWCRSRDRSRGKDILLKFSPLSNIFLRAVILPGHGMWPSLGQGANCALESAGIFAETIRDVAAKKLAMGSGLISWSEMVVREFQQRRHADALAAVDLTYGGIGARRSRGRQNAPLLFKLQVAVMMLLNKVSLGLLPKPALLRILSGEPVPYATAHRWNFFYEKWICGALGAAVAASVAARFLIE